MDLYILDRDFQELGNIDVFSSLIWNRKYYETGDFELHTAPEHFGLLREGAYLYRPDVSECCLIETPRYSLSSSGGREVIASGRALEQLLADRVIDSTQNLKGTGEEAARALIFTFAVNPSNASRKIEKLLLGPISGVGEALEMQSTGDNLLEKIQEICLSQQLSVRVHYDYMHDQLTAYVWQGKDRTEAQTANSWATFSTDYENILEVEFSDSVAEYKNFAYVAGEGEGAARVMVEVDETKGERRRELYVDARDLQRESLTMAQYQENLKQRGLEKLAEYQRQTTLDGAVDINANLVYRVDFDLGDICTYVDHEAGIEITQRITELSEVYEGGAVTVTASFGDQQLNILQKIKREVR